MPQEALVLRFDGTRLTIEVTGRLAGVFVDGIPVEGTGPVRPGAVIQVGHTLVECAVDAAKGRIRSEEPAPVLRGHAIPPLAASIEEEACVGI